MFMWKTSNTETVIGTPKDVWNKWVQVDKWPEQDESLISASIDGPFEVGSTITLKPKSSPTVKVVLVQVKPNDSFESVGKLPLTQLRFMHQIKPESKKVSFAQSVIMEGALSGLFSKLMGKKMEQNLKARMKKLAKMIEK